MLRSAPAPLLVALLTLAPATAHAEPPAPRVALAAIDDEVGLDPRAIADIAIALRGAALEEAIDVVSLGHADTGLDAARCDDACLDSLATQLGASVLLSGHITASGDGLQLALELRHVGETAAYRSASATAADTEAIVAAAEKIGRGLFVSLRSDAPPAPPRVHRNIHRAPPRSYAYDPGAAMQQDEPYSAGLAIGLELLFPGAGLVYVGDWGAFALEYAGIFGGFLLIMSSIDKVTGMSYGRDDEMVPVDDFVEKPVKSATLIKKINDLLASR